MFGIHFKFDLFTVFLVSIVFWNLYELFKSPKNLFAAFRLGVSLILIWIVLMPVQTIQKTDRKKQKLAVLVDVSKSMSIEDPEERLSLVQEKLKIISAALEKKFEITYYSFGSSNSKILLKNLFSERPIQPYTYISKAVEQIVLEKKGTPFSILLFSDGNETDSERPQGFQVGKQVPIYSVQSGEGKKIFDLSLKNLKGADFAFKNRPVRLIVTLQNYGFQARNVSVVLREVKNKNFIDLQIQNVVLPESGKGTEVTFEFIPAVVGISKYQIEVPVQPQEISKQNNKIDFQIEVGREKIRVLYLCGQPSFEYSFLRQVLKSDPTVDLVSFVILRNPESIVPVPEEQLSLIPFPSNDIFVKTINEFDLLIFENFSYSRLGIQTSHLENIKSFVEQRGGAFLMIGGENSFSKGGYIGTGIESLLPVKMNISEEKISPLQSSVRLLEYNHPIFNFPGFENRLEALWKNMPKMNGFNSGLKVKDGASLLATISETGEPAIVSWEIGKGRVMVMSLFSTWQWALGQNESISSSYIYSQFWENIIRWLISSHEVEPVQLIFDKPVYFSGQKNSFKVLLQQEKIKMNNPKVDISFIKEGQKFASPVLVPFQKNEYQVDFIFDSPGEYVIDIVVKEGSRQFEVKRKLEIQLIDHEMDRPFPNTEFLKQISEKSGGQFFMLSDFNAEKLINTIQPLDTTESVVEEKNLWLSPLLFSFLIGLLILEWMIKRYREMD